eukprot:CFRG3397T1
MQSSHSREKPQKFWLLVVRSEFKTLSCVVEKERLILGVGSLTVAAHLLNDNAGGRIFKQIVRMSSTANTTNIPITSTSVHEPVIACTRALKDMKPQGYDFYKNVLKSPKMIVAPMVNHSELAWRQLSRNYKADLCYTPMFHAELFATDPNYRKRNFTTNEADRPLIVQFCAHDADTLLAAAKHVEDSCDGVDINLGCPQMIAKRGHYGAFLMEDWDLIKSMVTKLNEECKVPVTCKIRMYDDVQKTIDYAKMLEAAGCQMLTLHGRTREQKGQQSGLANWQIVKTVKESVSIPVVSNGNLLYLEDAIRCMEYTGADGVMSAEGNLYNPAMFAGIHPPVWQLVDEYLQICREVGGDAPTARQHLFKIYHQALPRHTDIREKLGATAGKDGLEGLQSVADELNARLKAIAAKSEDSDSSLINDEFKEIDSAIISVERAYPYWLAQPRVRPDPNGTLGIQSRKRALDDATENSGGVFMDKEAVIKARLERKLRKAKAREEKARKLCLVCKMNTPSQKSGDLRMCRVCERKVKREQRENPKPKDIPSMVTTFTTVNTEIATPSTMAGVDTPTVDVSDVLQVKQTVNTNNDDASVVA